MLSHKIRLEVGEEGILLDLWLPYMNTKVELSAVLLPSLCCLLGVSKSIRSHTRTHMDMHTQGHIHAFIHMDIQTHRYTYMDTGIHLHSQLTYTANSHNHIHTNSSTSKTIQARKIGR